MVQTLFYLLWLSRRSRITWEPLLLTFDISRAACVLPLPMTNTLSLALDRMRSQTSTLLHPRLTRMNSFHGFLSGVQCLNHLICSTFCDSLDDHESLENHSFWRWAYLGLPVSCLWQWPIRYLSLWTRCDLRHLRFSALVLLAWIAFMVFSSGVQCLNHLICSTFCDCLDDHESLENHSFWH